jgi:hypothetical protein
MTDGPYAAMFGLTAEVSGEVVHADMTTETVTASHTTMFGLKVDVDGDVVHAHPELWDETNQLIEQEQ